MCKKEGGKSLVTAYLYTVSNPFFCPVKLCYVYIGATQIYKPLAPPLPFQCPTVCQSPCLVKWWGPKLGHVFSGETICIESSYCRMGLKSTHKVTKLYTLLMVALQFPFMVTCSGWVNSLWWSIDGFKPFYSIWLDVRHYDASILLSRTIYKIPPIYGHTSVKQQSILLYTKCPA